MQGCTISRWNRSSSGYLIYLQTNLLSHEVRPEEVEKDDDGQTNVQTRNRPAEFPSRVAQQIERYDSCPLPYSPLPLVPFSRANLVTRWHLSRVITRPSKFADIRGAISLDVFKRRRKLSALLISLAWFLARSLHLFLRIFLIYN